MTTDEIDKLSRQLENLRADKASNDNPDAESELEREEPDEEAEEIRDEVSELPSMKADDEKSTTELSEYGSQYPPDLRSRSSQRTSKTYISQLKKELENERAERIKLEKEIEKIKQISSEISSKLGINIHKD